MQQIWAIARKEFMLWAQKPGSWVTVFLVPLVFIWIMQAVFGSSGTPVISLFAVNEDQTSKANQVINALKESPNLHIDLLETREEADRRIGSGERMAAVIIPKGYQKDLLTPKGARIELMVDPARSEQANILNGLINAAISPLLINAEVSRKVDSSLSQIIGGIEGAQTPESTAEIIPGETLTPQGTATDTAGSDLSGEGSSIPSEEELTGQGSQLTPEAGLTASLTPAATETIDLSGENTEALKSFFTAAIEGVVSNQVQKGFDNPQIQLVMQPNQGNPAVRQPTLLDSLVPGYSLMFMFFLIPVLAVTVIEERQSGTLRRLLVSPISRSQILLGKMLPYFLIAIFQMTVILGISKLIFNISLGNSVISLAVMMITSALAMVTLGILIASLAKTEAQADGLAIIIVIALAAVSGSMFPTISVPGLQTITPHYWAIQGFINVTARLQGVEGILRPAGVLLTMSAVFFTIGAIRFRFE